MMKIYTTLVMILLAGTVAWIEAVGGEGHFFARVVFYMQRHRGRHPWRHSDIATLRHSGSL